MSGTPQLGQGLAVSLGLYSNSCLGIQELEEPQQALGQAQKKCLGTGPALLRAQNVQLRT